MPRKSGLGQRKSGSGQRKSRRPEEQRGSQPYPHAQIAERPRHAATVDLWSAGPHESVRAELEPVAVAEGPYGPGSAYPPADGSTPRGFSIKGNEASKLFHTNGSRYYSRAQADVWFDSEASAEGAGFLRWDRRGTVAHEVLHANRPAGVLDEPSDVA